MSEPRRAAAKRSPLRVLLVSRDGALAGLAVKALARAYEVAHASAESGDALRRRLQAGTWDLVLYDPSSADPACREVFAALRDAGDGPLLVVVAAQDDEDLAREMLRVGARAAVSPTRLGRLVPVVGRELADARSRRLRDLQVLVRSSPDPMLVARADGRILHVNRLLEQLLGYAEGELAGQQVELLVPERFRARHVAERQRYAASPAPRPMGTGMEFAARRKDGGEIPVEISLGPVRLGGEQLVCCGLRDLRDRRHAERLLRAILEGTAGETGEPFLHALVKRLAVALEVRYAFISEFPRPGGEDARVLAFWNGEAHAPPFDYCLRGTPCGDVARDGEYVAARGIRARFPEDARLASLGAESFFGVRLHDSAGAPLGVLAIVDVKPLANEASARSVMRIFAARAGAELERIRMTAALRESEERFRSLIELTTDYYWEQDAQFRFVERAGTPWEKRPAPAESLLGRKRWDLPALNLTEADWAKHRADLEAHREFRDLEVERLLPDGETRWISTSGRPIFDAEGRFRGYRGVGQDVTARKAAERALRESEERFRAIYEHAAVGIALRDLDGRWLNANQKLCDILGYERDELLGLTSIAITPLEERAEALQYNARMRRGEISSYTREKRYLRKDGTPVWVNLSVGVIRGPDGKPAQLITVVEDIGKRKQAEERLRENERLRDALMHNLPGMVYRCRNDPRWTLEFASQGCRDLTGHASEDLIGNRVLAYADLIVPEDRDPVWRDVQTALAERRPFELSYRIRAKDGTTKWVWERGRGVHAESGELLALEGYITDVTQRVLAEDALRQRESELRLISDNVPTMIAFVDSGLRYRYVNRRYAELFGRSPAQIIGRTIEEIVGSEGWQAVRPYVDAALKGDGVTYERRLSREDGGERELSVELVPHRDEAGRVAGIYALATDVTPRRRAEREVREREAEIRLIADNLPAMICYIGGDYRYRYANLRYAEFYTGASAPVEGKTLEEVLGGETWAAVRPQLERALAGETIGYQARRRRRSDGSMRNVEVSLIPHRDESGRVLGIYTLILDVTRRRRAEEALRLRNRALESSVNVVMITRPSGKGQEIVYVNPAFERITGYPADEALGRSPQFLHGEDRAQPGLDALRVAAREGQEATALVRNYRKDGTMFWNELRVAPVRNEAGQVTHFIGVSSDVTERVRYQEEIERSANYDSLTGLPNRNLLSDRLAQALLKSDRSKRPVGVLYLDLDQLKRINDSLGHAMGDQVIAAVGTRLTGTVRTGDTVARISGDEFVVVLADLKREDDAALVAAKVMGSIGTPLRIEAHEFVLTASAGVALYPKDGDDAATLLRNADTALYRAKEDGRDCYRFFAAEMNERAVRTLRLEQDLRSALEAGEFWLQYQPIVRLASGETVGAEALIRWRRSDGSMVPPAQFIPVAEGSGLIVPIGRWVLESAARQAARWNRRRRRPLFVSVNLSARQFRDPKLLDTVRATLEGAGIDPSLLKLEITESAVMQDVEVAERSLRGLKALGVQLSIDDFGTGYSSLAYLKRFPLDTLKIDRSFVRDLPADPDDVAICRAVIDLAKRLELEVVAEGIETREQAGFLAAHGCQFAQGYLFGRPVNPADFTAAEPKPKRKAARRGR